MDLVPVALFLFHEWGLLLGHSYTRLPWTV